MKILKLLFATALISSLIINNANACSRITYTTNSGNVVTGRTMDWESEDKPSIIVNQRRVVKMSASKNNPARWITKYGSVVVSSQSHLTNSGINEKGLAGDVLWLDASNYGSIKSGESSLLFTEYLQYLLDNFASVEEVVSFVNSGKIRPTNSQKSKSSITMKFHYILTDKTGDNAIIEYVNGEAKVYHKKGRIALTNDPTYDKMSAIKDYFKEIGILRNMPGSSLSQARYIYATGWLDELTNKKLNGYIKGIPNQSFDEQTVMSVLSVMRGVSTPLGVELTKAEPNNTSTLWRTVIDIKNNKFYFDSALAMTTVWVDLNKIDFATDHKSIDLSNGKILHGDVTEMLNLVKLN